jgi:ferredoxin--NADP+ reductase
VQVSELNGRVLSRAEVSDRLAILRVRPIDAPVPDFRPGQFVQLGAPREDETGVPRLEKRAYSIASSAADREALEFLIALVDGGRLTPALWPLRAGDACWIDARPHGSFTLEHVAEDKDLVLVATGSAIAPYASMLRTYGVPRWRRCVVVHGVRRAPDLAFRDELAARASVDASVCYLPVVSREPEASSWSGLRGRVQSVLEGDRCRTLAGAELDPASTHVFLCGNPSMIAEVRALLTARGFVAGSPLRGGNLHTERYW